MKCFYLVRDEDVTGISGTGIVAEGVAFSDDCIVVRWLGKHASTVVWSSLDDALAIHGHGGKTRIHWLESITFDHAVVDKLVKALREIAHYADNGFASYSGDAFLQAAHGLMGTAKKVLEETGYWDAMVGLDQAVTSAYKDEDKEDDRD